MHPVVRAGILDWGGFILGMILGISVALPSNYVFEYLRLFAPCGSYRSTLIISAYFFYIQMTKYMEDGFTGDITLGLMMWNFLTFGDALSGRRGTCKKDEHGFSDDFVAESMGQ